MSLQIWLPLNGNLNNQGLSDLEFSVSVAGVTAADNGKIGKSYSGNGSGTVVSNKRINLGKQHSMFCWVKLNSFNSSSNLTGLLGQHRYPIEAGMGLTCKYVSSTTGYLSVTWGDGVSREYVKQTGNTLLSAGKWYHVGYTYDGTTLIFYVNGKNDGEHTIKAEIMEDYFQLFSWSFGDYTSTQSIHSGYKLNGNLNDVRVYDHVLSPKEVHLISQGLFVHYPLRDPYIEPSQNLIGQPAKTGAVGSVGWDAANHIGAITVSNWSNGYNSGATSANGSKEPAKGYHAHWIEMDGIPTIKFPNINKAIIGNNRWLGTNSATQLQGTIGPNITYTISFDAMSTVPGMEVRMGYYFYNTSGTRDFHDGYCKAITTTSWKRYTKTITCKSNMDDSKAAFFYLYGHYTDVQGISYVRNIQVEVNDHATGFVKNTNTPTTCYDCSGFGNHANILGTMGIRNNSPRGDNSTFFEDGRYDYLKTNEIIIPTDEITMSCWFKASEAGHGSYHIPINFGLGHCEISINSSGKIRTGFYAPSRFVGDGTNTSVLDGEWHLLTTTFDGTTIKRYVDGVATASTSITSAPQPLANNKNNLFIGNYSGTQYGNKNACMADVRLYATALNADDILELYNTPIIITDNQKLIGNEFKEVE